MAEDGYSSSAWETTDNSDINSSSYTAYGRTQPHPPVLDIVEDHPLMPPIPSKSVSPPPRSSFDSASRWHDNIPVTVEHPDTTLSSIPSDAASLVETTFDENVLRALCELDVSTPIYLLVVFDLDNLYTTVWSPPAARSNKAKHGVM